MSEMPFVMRRSPYHGWLPRHREVLRAFIKEKVTKAYARKDRMERSRPGAEPLHTDPVARFTEVILGDSYMKTTFEKIFLQVNTDPKWVDPNYVVTNSETFLHLLDVIVQEPPAYYKAKREDGSIIGEPIGVPMLLVFDMLSNTSAAYDLFRHDPFNVALKNLLDAWGVYLKSTASNVTLTTGPEGWFSPEAMADFVPYIKPLTFEATYICPNPSAENKGFQSWDAFFTRELQPTARPIVLPDNSYLIHNACESTTLRFATNVKLHDTFWLKDQNYSLYDMLGGNDEDAQKFVGGTVYQAFLSPQDYHRWHSPITGTITKAVVLPGTYYAVLFDDGAPADDPDLEQGDPHGALIRSQPWLSVSSTRALIFIQSDNPDIGLVCFIGIGMAEVSTCAITVTEGQRVSVGEELGMFHFGGSSHTLIFGPKAKITFEDLADRPIEPNNHYWINTVIGKVARN
ncbi:phosphatidylserine decarboxylase [Boletus reticuloceps]|uniref:Phosphatidylserine decarboxylase n=1 Tax=Boletus reticuloceps TaxID=495285 RepID=A0A8I2YVY2_9AGAM|nr:phosphatidylserine decarboxylase [Boletus reticuloceps]